MTAFDSYQPLTCHMSCQNLPPEDELIDMDENSHSLDVYPRHHVRNLGCVLVEHLPSDLSTQESTP